RQRRAEKVSQSGRDHPAKDPSPGSGKPTRKDSFAMRTGFGGFTASSARTGRDSIRCIAPAERKGAEEKRAVEASPYVDADRCSRRRTATNTAIARVAFQRAGFVRSAARSVRST